VSVIRMSRASPQPRPSCLRNQVLRLLHELLLPTEIKLASHGRGSIPVAESRPEKIMARIEAECLLIIAQASAKAVVYEAKKKKS